MPGFKATLRRRVCVTPLRIGLVVLAQLAVMSLHTLQNHLRNTTAGARFSEIAGDMSARTSTTERQERDNKEAGASSAAEVTQTDCSKRL